MFDTNRRFILRAVKSLIFSLGIVLAMRKANFVAEILA